MQIFDRGRDIKNVLSVLNSSHSRTCLPENVCKFLFHCYVYAYVALVSMACGIMDEHGNIVNGFAFCSLLFYFFKLVHLHLEKREYKFDMKAVMASVLFLNFMTIITTNFKLFQLSKDILSECKASYVFRIVLKERDGLQRSEDACLFREVHVIFNYYSVLNEAFHSMIGILIALKKNEDADETKQSGKQKRPFFLGTLSISGNLKFSKNILVSIDRAFHNESLEAGCKFPPFLTEYPPFSRPHSYGALIRFPRGGGGMLFLLFSKHYLNLMNLLIAFLSNSMVYRSGKEHNNCYCKVLLQIESRKNLCLLSVLNSSHSRTCVPENVCKFLFHCYVYSYLALVSIVAGLRCAV
ncbi:hypothetical protein T4D_4783 [Trichinella pseudospiralis]|uniref:Uncharacterized protein n=1 Tax=Trichinella pseudospiralis TaxID=6337 RepID=A0A0V1FE37_TRIPS|nr:hypothetical protein T4D_4783 [Trichinella pseudospiralis]